MKIQNGFSLKPATHEAKAAGQDANLKDAAKMYENHFLNEMVKAMRSTVGQEEGVVKTNFAEKIFTEQLDQQYVDGWAQKGGVGLADVIYSQIKEQYLGGGKHPGMHQLNHVLPINPKKEPIGIPSLDSIQMKALPPAAGAKMSYRFEIPSPTAGGFDVQAPMAGRVMETSHLDHGWSSLKLDHGRGLTSELTFPGQVTALAENASVEPGQKLGSLDSMRPTLAWNLDWT